MGWEIQWKNGSKDVVDTNTLKRLAASGDLTRDTPVKSLSRNKTVLAGDIPYLFDLEPETAPVGVLEALPPPMTPAPIEPPAQPVMQEPAWITNYAAKSVPKRPRPGLFDVRFDSFVTVDLVSLIWQLALWFLAFSSLLQLYLVMRYIPMAEQWWIKALQVGFAVFVTISVTACLGLAVRVVLEAIVVLFKIEEHLRK